MKRELEPYQLIERSIIKKYRKELWTPFIVAVKRYELIQANDKIAVCISGGKDSMLMAKLMQELQRHGKYPFELVFLVMNPGYNQLNAQAVLDNARLLGIPIEVFHTEIFDIVANQGGSPCYLCARMRRGYLYSKARELGCNKIALGHHYDDVIETILMGMLYGSQIQTMMPKLHSTNYAGMELIRPLYLVREADINRGTFYAHYRDVYDLRDKIEAEMIGDFRDLIADIQPRETSTLEPVLTRAMDYLEENREIVTALVRGTGVEGFGRKMITVLEECRLEMLPYRTVEDTYAARFMSTGIVGMLEKWITDPQPIPKTEMTELILRALTQSLM